jgi:hypothetical protein
VREPVRHIAPQTDAVEQLSNPSVKRPPRQLYAMVIETITDLLFHPHHGIERVHRPLGDQRDLGQPYPPHLLFVETEQVDAVEQHLAAFDPPRRSDQPQQGQGDCRFARAGFPNQPQPLPLANIEADAVYGLHRATRGVVVHHEIPHFQHVTGVSG